MKKVLLLLIFLIALIPVVPVNKFLIRKLRPRESFFRLLLYIIISMALVFGYTYLLVFVILRYGPLPTR